MLFQYNNDLCLELNKNNFTAKVIKSPNVKGSVVIPRSINYENNEFIIISISKGSFKENLEIQSISFPEDSELRSIENESFESSSLESLFIPSTVSKLEEGWCKGASKLNNIIISPRNKIFLFINNEYLIDNDYTILFARRNIDKIAIQSNIKKIGSFAFEGCSSLKTIIFSSQPELISINKSAFKNSALESIKIPSSVSQIKDSAFYYCKSLKTIEFEANSQLNSIEDSVFCSTLIESIMIPSSVTQIGCFSFYGCRQLKTVKFEKNSKLLSINKSAFSDSSLKFISIPSSIKEIGECVFIYSQLKAIEFEEHSNLSVINSSAFSWVLLNTIIVPSSVTMVGENAFGSCSDLFAVEFLSEQITIDEICFDESENLFLVSFPNADEISLSKSSFSGVSEDLSLFFNCFAIVNISN